MDYISRETWGARYAAGRGSRPLPCSEAWLHHTVTRTLPVTATVAQECEQMRAVEAIGQQRFGRGFSYNLAVFPSGRVYVGCGVSRVGSHTHKRNSRALGIVLVGDYDRNRVPAPMRAALVEVLRDAQRLGWLRQPRFDGGHRDLKDTACPGRYGYALLTGVNSDARQAAPSGGTTEEDDVALSDEDVQRIAKAVAVHVKPVVDDAARIIMRGEGRDNTPTGHVETIRTVVEKIDALDVPRAGDSV